MALEILLRTNDPYEAEILRARLRAVGVEAVVHGGSQASLFGGAQDIIEQQLLVPQEQLAQARAFLDSSAVLDQTEATGESLGDAVCAVHEQQAIATCSRCGNFLCEKCGSLGNPPLCEECVDRPEPPVERGRWAKNLARLYVGLSALGILIVLVATVLAVLTRFWS